MKKNDTRSTTWELFYEIEGRLGVTFDLDVCTTSKLAKCSNYYTLDGPDPRDGLIEPWEGNVFCNPPFSHVGAWVDKAWKEHLRDQDRVICLIVPSNRTEQPWWQEHVEPYRDAPRQHQLKTINLPRRRLFNDENDQPILNKYGKVGSPEFGTTLLVWR